MTTALLLGLVAATCASFFFSGIETGIYSLSRVRLRLRASRGEHRAERIADLVRRPQLLISTILIGNHTANFAASYFSMKVLTVVLVVPDPELVNTLALTPFLFVFGEILPKNVFRLGAETLVYRLSSVLALANLAFRPIAYALRWFGRVSRALPRTTPAPDAILSRERLSSLVHEVTEEGVLTEEQRRMVANVMRLDAIPVRDAMIPLSEVDFVEEGFTREELVRVSRPNRRTRVPVVQRGSDRILGVVNVLDLVYREGEDPASLIQPAPSFRAHVGVDRALRALARERQQMGIVTDRNGRAVGIATMKDLVEEVSGELPVF